LTEAPFGNAGMATFATAANNDLHFRKDQAGFRSISMPGVQHILMVAVYLPIRESEFFSQIRKLLKTFSLPAKRKSYMHG
jgi:hypothetical protein